MESTRCEKYSLYFQLKIGLIIDNFAKIRSRGSGKGKESEYENGESDCPDEEEVSLHYAFMGAWEDFDFESSKWVGEPD